MSKPSNFAALILLAMFCGCSPMRYANYTGPTGFSFVGSGTMSETSYSIPVYRGWPERPYRLIGSIRFVDPRKFWDDGVIHMAARTAKRHGGDAIIIRQGAEFGVGKITGVANREFALAVNQTTALVVRWFTKEEIRAQEVAKEEFLRQAHVEHPDLRPNESVEDIMYQLLVSEGHANTATKGNAKKSADWLYEISKAAPNDLSGSWVYKGTVTLSSLTVAGDEEALLGIASVKVDGESIAIVSHTGRSEVNFTGTYVKGRLTGQIGIGGFSTKSDGAAVNNKISLSFQSVTTDGTVRGNVSLQR